MSPMSFLLCFCWKDHEKHLFSKARQIISTTMMKTPDICFLYLPFFLSSISPASREPKILSLLSYLLLYPIAIVLQQPTQIRCSRGTKKSLAHFGTYRYLILDIVLGVGRGPHIHHDVSQFSPPQPAHFMTCYHNSQHCPC